MSVVEAQELTLYIEACEVWKSVRSEPKDSPSPHEKLLEASSSNVLTFSLREGTVIMATRVDLYAVRMMMQYSHHQPRNVCGDSHHGTIDGQGKANALLTVNRFFEICQTRRVSKLC